MPFRPGALQIPSAEIVLEEQQRRGAELRGKRPLKGRAAIKGHSLQHNVVKQFLKLILKPTRLFNFVKKIQPLPLIR